MTEEEENGWLVEVKEGTLHVVESFLVCSLITFIIYIAWRWLSVLKVQ